MDLVEQMDANSDIVGDKISFKLDLDDLETIAGILSSLVVVYSILYLKNDN
jgi:hypothetical protein